jgi:hypothetical protein
VDTVEAAILAQVKEEIAKTFFESDKAMMVHAGGNKAGRFLEVTVMAEGGRKGVIWLPEGRFGRGWRRFSRELWQSCSLATHGASLVGPILDAPLLGGRLWEVLRGRPSFFFEHQGESSRFQGVILEASRFVSGVVLL